MRSHKLFRHPGIPILLLTMLSASTATYGQCDQVPNFISVPIAFDSAVDSDRIINTDRIYAGFEFVKQTDSVVIHYRVSDFTVGGKRIIFETWCPEKNLQGLSNAALSDSSASRSFTVAAGDTVFFLRDFSWVDEAESGSRFYLDRFRSADTLDYAVELVDAVSGNRAALLDSIGVLRNVSDSMPTLYGGRGIVSAVAFEVPSSLDTREVYLRVNVYARGDSGAGFIRKDRWAIDRRRHRFNPTWQLVSDHIDTATLMSATLPGGGYDPDLLQAGRDDAGRISIHFTPSGDAQTSITIFNSRGEQVFIPAYLPSVSPPDLREAMFVPEVPGVYYVALLYDERVVAAARVEM